MAESPAIFFMKIIVLIVDTIIFPIPNYYVSKCSLHIKTPINPLPLLLICY